MRTCSILLVAFAMTSHFVKADSGDVEGSHDYPGFPRVSGFTITDYDEDNPGDFNFPVSRPLPTDAENIEQVHVTGHRYRIRYELGTPGRQPSLLETQQYYEKLAAAAGYKTEKSGAVGDLTETFHLISGERAVWVYLEPSGAVNVLTVVEEKLSTSPTASSSAISNSPSSSTPAPGGTAAAPDDIETALVSDGRASVLLDFLPDKAELHDDQQPIVDRIAKILQEHADWHLVIQGHTDSTGDPQDNQFLSAQRARTVRGMLIADGIKPTRITAIGLGGSYPVADDKTAEGRMKNRRIELVVRKE